MRDGRVAIILMISCSLTVTNLCLPIIGDMIKSSKAIIGSVDNTTLLLPHDSYCSCSLERRRDCEEIPNDLRPLLFLPVQINSAGKELLITVKGIGPGLASEIIKFRERNGSIKSIDQLKAIRGVGEKRAQYFSTVLTFDETSWIKK